jgi:hypothetical protein
MAQAPTPKPSPHRGPGDGRSNPVRENENMPDQRRVVHPVRKDPVDKPPPPRPGHGW